MLCTYPDIAENLEQQEETKDKRYINVLLMRYPNVSAKMFRIITRGTYNHATIGVSDSDGTFYSYVSKGFRKELPKLHPTFKKKEVPCKLYRIEISDEIYAVTKATLDDHERQSHKFKYNTLGLMLSLLRIVYTRRNRYFCSQFVSEILDQMRAVPLAKHSLLYLPDDFMKMEELKLCFSGHLSQLVSLSKPANILQEVEQ